MFFRNYVFVFLAIVGQSVFADERSQIETVEPTSKVAEYAVSVLCGAAIGTAIGFAGPAIVSAGLAAASTAGTATAAAGTVATGVVASKPKFLSTVAKKTASAAIFVGGKAKNAAVATKKTLVAVGPTVSRVYRYVLGAEAAIWAGSYVKEKKYPSTEQKLNKLMEEKENEMPLEEVLTDALEQN